VFKVPPAFDRRRSVRIDVSVGEFIRLEMRDRLQVLDISLSGALVASNTALPVGARGRLVAGLAAALPFDAEVVAKRQELRPKLSARAAFGAAFLTMDERSRRALEQFLRRARD
jgi:c-di-GMP-binding flagellar brake protein YcgR